MTSEKPELIGNYQVVEGQVKTRREVLLMGALAAGGLMAVNSAEAAREGAKEAAAPPAAATATGAKLIAARDFSHLVSKKMAGLSSKQIEQHLKLYNGYVGKINEIQTLLQTVDIANANATYHPMREMLVEESYALNGVVYHELYFGSLGGKGGEPTGELKAALEDQFGNIGQFIDYFKAAGKCMRGWVIVGWNTRDGKLHTYGLDLHNMFVPANVVPVVVLDVYEHAYMIDYATDRGAYLDAFLKNNDWDVCNNRFNIARKHPTGTDATA